MQFAERQGDTEPFRKLSRSLLAVCDVMATDLSRQWVEGSQAFLETRAEPLAGLARRPASDAIRHAQLSTVAAVDHVRATACLIDADSVIYSVESTARGALEAFGQAHYLADPTIDSRERVRRHTNIRLIDLKEQEQLLAGTGHDQEMEDALAQTTKKIGEIVRAAGSHRFKVQRTGNRLRRPPFLVPDTPWKAQLAADVIDSANPSLGKTVYRLLSSTSHTQPFGLSQSLIVDWVDLDPVDGAVHAWVGIRSDQLAIRLSVIPLALHVVAHDLYTLMGWQPGGMHAATQVALQTWASAAGVPLVGLAG
jgi:hypothetical protein